MRRLSVLVCLALVAMGCGRSFTAPRSRPGPARPTVKAVVPAAAYGGQTVSITGADFDPVAQNNVVAFPGGTARAREVDDAGNLRVDVPQSAAPTGPVAVTTAAGPSAPAGAFTYLGAGHPVVGGVLAEIPLLHRPRTLATIRGEVLLASSLFRALVSPGHPPLPLPTRPSAFAAAPDGSFVVAGYDADRALEKGVSATVIDPLARTVRFKALPVGVTARFLAAGAQGPGAPMFYLVGDALDGTTDAVAFWAGPSGLTPSTQPLPLARALGAAAAPDGSFVLVSGLGPPGFNLVAAQADGGARFLRVDGGVAGALALAVLDGLLESAVALDDGSVLLLGVDDGGTMASVSSNGLGAVGALAFANLADGGALLVMARPSAAEVDGVDPRSGALLWATTLPEEPGQLAIDVDAGKVFVTDGTRNDVSTVDLFTGAPLGRVGFGLELGNARDGDFGAVTTVATPASTVFVLARSPEVRAAVPLDAASLTLGDPVPLRVDGALRGLVRAPDDSVWVVHDHALGRLGPIVDGGHFKHEDLMGAVPALPTQLAFGPGGEVLVGRAGGIDTFLPQPAPDGGLTLTPAASIALAGTLSLLSARPDGGVLAVWSAEDAGNSAAAALWSVGGLTRGEAPEQLYAPEGNVRGLVGALDLAAGPLVMVRSIDGGITPQAIWLGPNLQPAAEVDSLVKEPGPYLATPDGRAFVWARRLLGDRSLRLDTTGDFDGGMTEQLFYTLSGPFGRPTFDLRGEWMFVPESSNDSVLVVH